ncbi:MAG: hypothetical protein H6Q86_6041 [candidate division NC10 bacterium]|nr:hypothetical protein [candidate division NC10 bacterium]
MRGSKDDIPVAMEEAGAVIQDAVWDDIHVSFETFRDPLDTTPLHSGAPDDSCQCPHWGYVFSGRIRVVYKDREEIVKAGDAYYMQPGHNVIIDAGTHTVEFSPNGPFQAGMEVVMRNLEALRNV